MDTAYVFVDLLLFHPLGENKVSNILLILWLSKQTWNHVFCISINEIQACPGTDGNPTRRDASVHSNPRTEPSLLVKTAEALSLTPRQGGAGAPFSKCCGFN